MCRGKVLCAGAKSYAQGESFMCRGKVVCTGVKSYVQRQSLVALCFYGVNAVLCHVLCSSKVFCAGVKFVIFKQGFSRGVASDGSDFRKTTPPWKL